MTGDRDLMRAHVEALFTHDGAGDLVRVNEPNAAPAPRFFLGKTAEGAVWRFRYDVDQALRRELEALAADDDVRGELLPQSASRSSQYESILARSAPVQRIWTGPAFCFAQELPASVGTTLITEGNESLLHPYLQDWIPDVERCRPMVALTVDGSAVSVCASVRRTGVAHEAGIETARAYRGRGYAGRVATAWAAAVRDMGLIPLYSTSWQNEASRAVARKLALAWFGSDLHIT